MAHFGFGFIAITGIAAYVYATVGSLLTTLAFIGVCRFTQASSRRAAGRVVRWVGVGFAVIVGFAGLSVGLGAAAFVGITAGVTTLVWGVGPVGLGVVALSRLTDAVDPVGLAFVGWFPSLVAPFAVAYTVGLPSSAVALLGVLAVPVVGPTAVAYAVHRARSR